jgi:two-component system response regulator RegX3
MRQREMAATVLKFTGPPPSDEAAILSAGSIHIDLALYQAFAAGRAVTLTYQEFELLRLLLAKPDRIIAYGELVQGLWGSASSGTRRRLGVVVCRLRAKLGAPWPYRIQTVRGRGYGLTLARESSEE